MSYTSFTSSPSASTVFVDAVANSTGLNSSSVSITSTSPMTSTTSSATVSMFSLSFLVETTETSNNGGGVTIFFTVKVFIESLGFSDYNLALNHILALLSNSLTTSSFLSLLHSLAIRYDVTTIYATAAPSTFVYLSSSVSTVTSSSSSSSSEGSGWSSWPVYGQALLIVGAGVLGAVAIGVMAWWMWHHCQAPLSSFHANMQTRHSFVRRLQLLRQRQQPSTTKTDIINPAAKSAALPNTTSSDAPGMTSDDQQQFITLVIAEEQPSGKSSATISEKHVIDNPTLHQAGKRSFSSSITLASDVIHTAPEPIEEKADSPTPPLPLPKNTPIKSSLKKAAPPPTPPSIPQHQTPLLRKSSSNISSAADIVPPPSPQHPKTSSGVMGMGGSRFVGASLRPSEMTMTHFLTSPPVQPPPSAASSSTSMLHYFTAPFTLATPQRNSNSDVIANDPQQHTLPTPQPPPSTTPSATTAKVKKKKTKKPPSHPVTVSAPPHNPSTEGNRDKGSDLML